MTQSIATTPALPNPPRSVGEAMKRGALGRCPACGEAVLDPAHGDRVHFTVLRPDPTTADALAEAAAQVFLGLRLACARCHWHPTEPWGPADFEEIEATISA